jgi:hypothetical protein
MDTTKEETVGSKGQNGREMTTGQLEKTVLGASSTESTVLEAWLLHLLGAQRDPRNCVARLRARCGFAKWIPNDFTRGKESREGTVCPATLCNRMSRLVFEWNCRLLGGFAILSESQGARKTKLQKCWKQVLHSRSDISPESKASDSYRRSLAAIPRATAQFGA